MVQVIEFLPPTWKIGLDSWFPAVAQATAASEPVHGSYLFISNNTNSKYQAKDSSHVSASKPPCCFFFFFKLFDRVVFLREAGLYPLVDFLKWPGLYLH